jgi:hypothetical protein
VLLAVCAALTLGACARQGDLGRTAPSMVNDRLLPLVGMASTHSASEPISGFNYTDDEQTLRALGWTLVAPTHAQDWLGHSAAELQRTEIVRRLDLIASPQRYASLLTSARYRSSDTRYARIMDDAAKDMAAIGPYFAYVARVRAADEQRLQASLGLPDIRPQELTFAHGRIAQNQRQMAWVKRAILFRIYAYRYAVDRLMIQTPSHLAGQTIERINALEALALEVLDMDTGLPPISDPAQGVDLMELVTKD